MIGQSNNQELQDKVLWDGLRKGSEEAFAQIYDRYVPVLYSYGSHLTPDKELVRDCLQDLFVTLWHSRQTLGTTDSIRYYLFRSLRREIVRKQRGHYLFSPDAIADQLEQSVEEQLIAAEANATFLKSLQSAMTALSDRQREAIFLRFYQDLSFEDVALILEITPRAVYKLIYRAIEVLQSQCLSKTSWMKPLRHAGLLLLFGAPFALLCLQPF